MYYVLYIYNLLFIITNLSWWILFLVTAIKGCLSEIYQIYHFLFWYYWVKAEVRRVCKGVPVISTYFFSWILLYLFIFHLLYISIVLSLTFILFSSKDKRVCKGVPVISTYFFSWISFYLFIFHLLYIFIWLSKKKYGKMSLSSLHTLSHEYYFICLSIIFLYIFIIIFPLSCS